MARWARSPWRRAGVSRRHVWPAAMSGLILAPRAKRTWVDARWTGGMDGRFGRCGRCGWGGWCGWRGRCGWHGRMDGLKEGIIHSARPSRQRVQSVTSGVENEDDVGGASSRVAELAWARGAGGGATAAAAAGSVGAGAGKGRQVSDVSEGLGQRNAAGEGAGVEARGGCRGGGGCAEEATDLGGNGGAAGGRGGGGEAGREPSASHGAHRPSGCQADVAVDGYHRRGGSTCCWSRLSGT